ncbi:protein associated with UVRAG as autophagy enhancer isoform X2 [Xenopus laevis]|uniref:Protein associated with UVRAG as autophagy enhancer isoform X2 n=1 Tax=Xenopus laevis TaxID=8355 RepID=A0A8J0UPC5_XENLA|nr:protein associated with UVRAG as autophagy enhancer isoform X2 [Xenopus laevis]
MKTMDIPSSPFNILPRMASVQFPSDELPRPAVIGLSGSCGSYPDSATAIKEILSSVLNIPSSIKSISADPQDDSDLEDWEDSTSGDLNDDSDSDSDCDQFTCSLLKDMQFKRSNISWDNLQTEGTEAVPTDLITVPSHVAAANALQNLPDKTPQVNFSGQQKDARRFSSPNISSLRFDQSTINCTSAIPDLPISVAVSGADLCSNDVQLLRRRSQSFSSILKALDTSLTASTEILNQSTENTFEPTVNLENENAHFLVADIFISVVENLKSGIQSMHYEQLIADSRAGCLHSCKNRTMDLVTPRQKKLSESAASFDSGYEGLFAMQHNFPPDSFTEHSSKLFCEWPSFTDTAVEELEHPALWHHSCMDYSLEPDSKHRAFWQNPPVDMSTTHNSNHAAEMVDDKYPGEAAMESVDKTDRENPAPGSNSAEQTLKKLYRGFRRQWLQYEAEIALVDPPALNTENTKDFLPEEFESSLTLTEEIRKFRMREAEEWAPPRFQIINTIHPSPKRDVIVASQNNMCTGCGTKVEPRYNNRLRYCEYLGKYFCDCCHSNSLSFIPAQILLKFNFGKYHVSNFSKNVVDSIWQSHKFNVLTENPEIYKKVKDLNKIKELQERLISIKRLLCICRFARSLLKEFKDIPSHLTEELDLFTLSDLFNVKQKLLLPALRELMATSVTHVANCELCQAKGFICEFCHSPDVLFPFQMEMCRRCEVCKTCYHKKCFYTGDCPKCCRMERRKALKRSPSPSLQQSERKPVQ